MKNIKYEITPKVKEYLVERVGKRETTRLLHFMKMGNWIMLTDRLVPGNQLFVIFCWQSDILM